MFDFIKNLLYTPSQRIRRMEERKKKIVDERTTDDICLLGRRLKAVRIEDDNLSTLMGLMDEVVSKDENSLCRKRMWEFVRKMTDGVIDESDGTLRVTQMYVRIVRYTHTQWFIIESYGDVAEALGTFDDDLRYGRYKRCSVLSEEEKQKAAIEQGRKTAEKDVAEMVSGVIDVAIAKTVAAKQDLYQSMTVNSDGGRIHIKSPSCEVVMEGGDIKVKGNINSAEPEKKDEPSTT